MNLDMAITNTLKRNPMENAMHGVMSNFGAQYELNAYSTVAKFAEEFIPVTVGVASPSSIVRPSIPGVTIADAPLTGYQTEIPGYRLVFVPAGTSKVTGASAKNIWCLYRLQEDKPGFWARLSGNTETTWSEVVVAEKSGARSSWRIIDTIKGLPNMENATKQELTSSVAAHMNQGVVPVDEISIDMDASKVYSEVPDANLIYGLMVDEGGDVTPIVDSDIAGSAPFGAEGFGSTGPMELGMAPTYTGVKLQRNNTFMGDTMIHTPLTRAQAGMTRTPLGDPVGVHTAPPTRMIRHKQIRNSRSL